jgi:hypothetical protein
LKSLTKLSAIIIMSNTLITENVHKTDNNLFKSEETKNVHKTDKNLFKSDETENVHKTDKNLFK